MVIDNKIFDELSVSIGKTLKKPSLLAFQLNLIIVFCEKASDFYKCFTNGALNPYAK
jgi:hypothetical protein